MGSPSAENDNDALERLNRLVDIDVADEKASTLENNEDPLDSIDSRNRRLGSSARTKGQKPQKNSQMCDDREHSQVTNSISFKSWQSKGGAPTTQDLPTENERFTKDVRKSKSDYGDGTKVRKLYGVEKNTKTVRHAQFEL